MICRILLLISLTSCVSGTFEVKVTQTSYQAEENHNITLEWMFTTKPDSSSTSLNIYCEMFIDHNDPVLYHVHEGDEVPESQDEQFAGRIQSDKDALREGRIRLHVSRLRTDDSGLYTCDVKTDYGVSSDRCLLNVTAVDQPEPQKPTERPQPESQGRIGLYVGLTAAGLAVCAGLCLAFRLCLTKYSDKTGLSFRSRSYSANSSKNEQTTMTMVL
ncbi:butyrophilin-like protein 8 isoform X2 [Scomber scombrus]|uniref:butyrophilin-like protein 8 isoform X2 n=1 Tax=Scomber scombrus TaxID=13677 RepID=UPI002DDB5873|nr:butyrophilin-like protein 8 isoform X2 [Scomber scombrus]